MSARIRHRRAEGLFQAMLRWHPGICGIAFACVCALPSSSASWQHAAIRRSSPRTAVPSRLPISIVALENPLGDDDNRLAVTDKDLESKRDVAQASGWETKSRVQAVLVLAFIAFIIVVPNALLLIVYVGDGWKNGAGAANDSFQRTLDLMQ